MRVKHWPLLTLAIALALGIRGQAIAAITITTSSEASTSVVLRHGGGIALQSDTQENYSVTFYETGDGNYYGYAVGSALSTWGVQQARSGPSGALSGSGITTANKTDIRNQDVVANASGKADVQISSSDSGTLYLVYGRSGLPPDSVSSSVQVRGEPSSSLIFSTNDNSGIVSIANLSDFSIRAAVNIGSASNFTSGDSSAIGGLMVWWGFNNLPGSTPDNPLVPAAPVQSTMVILPDGLPDVTPFFPLTFPVTEDYGVNNFIYVDPTYATGYSYHVDGSAFASFTIPGALPGGDDLFELLFGNQNFSLHAGDVFNFTDYVPGGITDFKLTGINLGEQVDPDGLPPFVAGFKFTSEGVVTLTQTPILEDVEGGSVPEPASMAIWGIGALGCVITGYRRRKAA